MTIIAFQPMRYTGDNTVTPTHLPATEWTVPDASAQALDALNALPRISERIRAQYELLNTAAVNAPGNVLGYGYDHPFTVRIVAPNSVQKQ